MIELNNDFPSIGGLRHLDNFPSEKLDMAAVIMLFVKVRDEFHLLFTKRSQNLRTHKGEISFPGGHRDPGEASPLVTALRECEEEVGLSKDDIKVLGALDKVISHRGKMVFPIVGVYLGSVEDVVANEDEISELSFFCALGDF